MNDVTGAGPADDARPVITAEHSSGKPMSPQAHFEVGGQREDARRHGDDEFDSATNIIAGDRVPKHTPEADRARVARAHRREALRALPLNPPSDPHPITSVQGKRS